MEVMLKRMVRVLRADELCPDDPENFKYQQLVHRDGVTEHLTGRWNESRAAKRIFKSFCSTLLHLRYVHPYD